MILPLVLAASVALAQPRVDARLTPEQKIHRSALRASELHVVFHRDVSFDDARAAILASGAALMEPLTIDFAPSKRVRVRRAGASLEVLAADASVLAIVGANRFRAAPDNALAARWAHVPEVQEAPYGLSGDGVAVSLFEFARAEAEHAEFGGRLHVPSVKGSSGNEMHATHVAGTIGAAGLLADAKGMAPNVEMHQFCLPNDNNTCSGDWLVAKDRELASRGIVADNNSWSFRVGWDVGPTGPVWNAPDEDRYGAYDLTSTAPLDAISIERGVLFVQSAGNEAQPPTNFQAWFGHRHADENGNTIPDKLFCYSDDRSGNDCPAATCTGGCEIARHTPIAPFGTLSMTAAAKNVLAVGALGGENVIAPFSSRGPAKDGRVKPDVVARGTNVLSTVTGGLYQSRSGTSMSTPVVTGVAALLTEQWRRTFGLTPTPAQLKALIIAGADDVGNPGPDYTFGFGSVNAKRSADAIIADAAQGRRIRTMEIAQGSVQEIAFVITQPQSVRILVHWADPAIPFLGTEDSAAKALVNDLDVSVLDPSGAVLHPYVLDKDRYTKHATTGVNTVDNVEMLEIANAEPGTYRIRVSGTQVPEGPQIAVLVSSIELGERRPRRRAVR